MGMSFYIGMNTWAIAKQYLQKDAVTLKNLADLLKSHTTGKSISLSIIAFNRLIAELDG